MNFKWLYGCCISLLFLAACSAPENEASLVNLHTAASQDIISISFPADLNESIISANSSYSFALQGLTSNRADTVTLAEHVVWSLSDNSNSRIDQNGLLSAGNVAERITVNATFGQFSASMALSISLARFNKVVQLNSQAIEIGMCQTQAISPIASYLDADGNEEIRAVDNTTLAAITWIIINANDRSRSQSAEISTANNTTLLRTLSPGNYIVQATATSLSSGNEVTSDDMALYIDNNLTSMKLCNSSDTDLSSCSISVSSLEQYGLLSVISVGTYQASDGSNQYENISFNSKWGTSNSNYASIAINNSQQLDITGVTSSRDSTISAACGEIEQSISGLDITQGIALSELTSCASGNLNCVSTTDLFLSITDASISSLEAEADGNALTDGGTLTLTAKPTEITLAVWANFINNSSRVDITSDSSLVYAIQNTGPVNIIEAKDNSAGVFTVLSSGTARIELDYKNEKFTINIIIP